MLRKRWKHVRLSVCAVGAALLAAGCSTIDWPSALFAAGQEHRRRQWELEHGRPSLDWAPPNYAAYRAARADRLRGEPRD